MRVLNVATLLAFMYLFMFVAILNGFGVTEVTQPANAQVAGVSTTKNIIAGNPIVDQINEIRQNSGLSQLNVNVSLNKISTIRANDMLANNYFAHKDKNGRDYTSLLLVKPGFSCENLDLGSSNKAEDIVRDWMESKLGHRECLLDPRATEIGFSTEKYNVDGNADSETYISVLILSNS